MGRFVIVIAAVSIARELWRFGEDELAERALALTSAGAADIGERAGSLDLSGAAEQLWPIGPRGTARATMLAVTEHLEGQARPCLRNRRRPEKLLPAHLQRTGDELWAETNQ